MSETKTVKFPNGSTIIFYTPKSGIDPRRIYGALLDTFYVPVLDLEALKVFEKFACTVCNEDGNIGKAPWPNFETCPICKGSKSLYREVGE